MTTSNNLLRNLRIATPCHVGWENMTGDERVRFCDSCKLHVYNFSELTSREIESLVLKTNGRLCGRMYQRADGTILTRDCPVGLRAVRHRVARFAGAVFATILGLCSVTFSQTNSDKSSQSKQTASFKIEHNRTDVESFGKLIGTVVNSAGGVLIGAEVTLKNNETREQRTTRTDELGTFLFGDLSTGKYVLSMSAPGMKQFQVTDIELLATEGSRAEIRMEDGVLLTGAVSVQDHFDEESTTSVNMIKELDLLMKQQRKPKN